MNQLTDQRPAGTPRFRILAGYALALATVAGGAGVALGQVPPAGAAPGAAAAPGGAASPGAAGGAAATATRPAARSIPIPNPIKTLAQAPPAATLSGLITPEVSNLSHPDAKVQGNARRLLIEGASAGGAPASPAYQAAYAAALNTALTPVFRNPDLRTRLNAGIVLAGVASKFDPTAAAALAPAALAAVNDKAEPVALWGVKAAATIIPGRLDANDPALATAVAKTVIRFPASGAIADEAYAGLTGNPIFTVPARRAAALPAVVSLLNWRTDLYTAATAAGGAPDSVPGSPFADNAAVLYFSRLWAPNTPMPQKQQMAGAMLDFATALSELSPLLPRRAPVDPPEEARQDELVELIRRVGSAAGVIAGREQKPNLQKAASAVGGVTPGQPAGPLVAALGAEFTAAGITPAPHPPPLPPAGGPPAAAAASGAATRPATQPATGSPAPARPGAAAGPTAASVTGRPMGS